MHYAVASYDPKEEGEGSPEHPVRVQRFSCREKSYIELQILFSAWLSPRRFCSSKDLDKRRYVVSDPLSMHGREPQGTLWCSVSSLFC